MKKNVMMRVASALLVAVLMTTCAISGTFAKYTSTATGSDTARVAKWDVKLNDTTANSNTFTFDLFKTINDTIDGNTETDITPNDGTIIAPGTQGSFDIVIKNASEVTAKYVIDYTVTNTAGIPVKFSLDGTNWKDNINQLDIDDLNAVTLSVGASQTITVHWMWAFEGDDVADTTLGLAGSAQLTVEAKITATQVD